MDSRKVWLALGVKDEGIEWFDAIGLAGSHGNDATGLGWTATSADTSWVTAKHSLGEVYAGNFTPEKIDSIKSRILFRVGLGAIASASPLKTRDGLAFDNVFIGNRTRTVLLENFTSMAQGVNTKIENEAINTLATGTDCTELIVITYHKSFTDDDDLLNLDNPSEPGARALYSGVSTSPRVAIDGSTGPESSANNSNLLFTDWGETFYNKKSLQLAPFEIILKLDRDNINDGKVRIFADITAIEDIDTCFVVHIAVVEKEILPGQISISGFPDSGESIFYNTLRKLLPNAAGTQFIGSKPLGNQISLNETWDPTNVVDPDGTANSAGNCLYTR